MKIQSSAGNDPIAIIGILILFSGIGYLMYTYYKKRKAADTGTGSSSTGTGSTSNSNSSTPTRIEPGNGKNNKPNPIYPPIADLQNTELAQIITVNPHFKGEWMSGGNRTIIEHYTGKNYKKDKPLEIFAASKKYNLYLVKYYGDMCYFPMNEISEEGQW